MKSALAPDLIQAYRETDYKVFAVPPFTLHIGIPSPSLGAIFRANSVTSCAFITGFNPRGEALSETINRSRHQQLVSVLNRRSLKFIDGIGQHPDNGWPGEDSVLVLGLSLAAARRLGQDFEQNALVWCGADCTAKLELLR